MATSLPKAVQRQLEQAEAALQAQTQVPAGPPVVSDVAHLQATPQVQEAAPPAPTPAPAPVVQAPAAPEPPPAEDWQQKYRTLQGMFQRQVPELQTLVKTLESRLAAATEQITALQAARQVTAPAVEPPKPEIDPRDARAFGEDMVEMVNRYAQRTFQATQQQFNAALGAFDKRLAALEKAVNGVSQKAETSMESTFYATLDSLVPDWKSINASAEWLEWLGQVDEIYNVPRQTALDLAFERRDAARVATVFKKFKESRPRPTPPATPPIAPADGGTATAPAVSPAKPILSQKAVMAFYTDVAKGRYRGREDEQARIEAEINLAAQEQRIV